MASSSSEPIKFVDMRPKTLKQLKRHVQQLADFRWGENNQSDGFDYEFNLIEKRSEGDTFFEDFTSAKLPENRAKNRYSNVLPLESTRVEVRSDMAGHIGGSSYINANFITRSVGVSQKRAYIACQGCLKHTVPEFWSMVWSENANLIVMLTKITEGDKQKCYQYWSSKRPKIISGVNKEPLFTVAMAVSKSLEGDDLVFRRFYVKHHPSGETREISHLQYIEWPDHGTPKVTATFRHLLRMVDAVEPKGPIVVHCSAGIGRTGTFCTVHMNLSILNQPSVLPPKFDILGTVLRLRKERCGMVQTKEQYMFCYLAVLEGALEWKRAQDLGLEPVRLQLPALVDVDTTTDIPILLAVCDDNREDKSKSRSNRRSRSKGPKSRSTKK